MEWFRISQAVCAALLVACSLGAAQAGTQQYPIEIHHAFGTTVIPEEPERVATVAWANHEVPLALGIVPVGFAAANFGDDDGNGLLPWVEARLEELGAESPKLFDEGDGIDFEAVAASAPDVILAAYSGLSRSDYDTLSKIAPVVAYPEAPWATGWRDMIRLDSAGMGMAEEGEALIARIEAQIAATAAAHPELAGKTAMFVTHLDPTDLSRVSFYTDNDARVRFFHDLGLASPRFVKEVSTEGKFAGEISAERIDELADVDILVTYGGQPLVDRLSAHPLTSRLPAVEHGSLVMLDNSPLGTAANPTPMSIPWILDDYADLLSHAARKSE
ncbi:iron-siderophore ABC transporter substrate-binding protein [Aidingimonas lacisalsi]|uniref:iron-siderophore ABC transporter substrate-binding protein n=1 Tax=Aidingimonas lacisalsi TaxID=2604086 RepID=UPI0011D279F1|nr:iron-siderophore ABC transporter substrate-binding protein [Aidingimonas lacisalsi]